MTTSLFTNGCRAGAVVFEQAEDSLIERHQTVFDQQQSSVRPVQKNQTRLGATVVGAGAALAIGRQLDLLADERVHGCPPWVSPHRWSRLRLTPPHFLVRASISSMISFRSLFAT